MKKNHFEIKNQSSNSAEILIYGIVGDYWEQNTAKDIVSEIRRIEAEKITVKIYSEGGSVFAGLAIYNALMEHSASVTVRVDSLAASIASVVAMAGERVEMPKNAFLMIHNPWMLATGDENEMIKAADLLGKIKKSIISAYNTKTGIDDADLSMMMDDETWLMAKEAVDMGFADTIIGDAAANNAVVFNQMNNFRNIPDQLKGLLNTDKDSQDKNQTKEKADMDLKTFKEKHPEIAKTLFDEGFTAGSEQGTQNERTRIQDVRAQAMPGHEALADELAFDGKTTGPEAAVRILQAERQIRSQAQANIHADKIPPVDQPTSPEPNQPIDKNLPVDERAKATWDKDAAIRDEFEGDFDAYLQYEKAVERGSVRSLKSK